MGLTGAGNIKYHNSLKLKLSALGRYRQNNNFKPITFLIYFYLPKYVVVISPAVISMCFFTIIDTLGSLIVRPLLVRI